MTRNFLLGKHFSIYDDLENEIKSCLFCNSLTTQSLLNTVVAKVCKVLPTLAKQPCVFQVLAGHLLIQLNWILLADSTRFHRLDTQSHRGLCFTYWIQVHCHLLFQSTSYKSAIPELH